MINRTQRDSVPPFRHPNSNTDSFSGGGADLNIKSLLRGVWTRSLIGLILIAILSTTTFFIISSLLKLNEKSGTIVNISGRQRMLSQRGAFFALQVSTNTNKQEREIAITKLAAVADLMEKSHLGLTEGSDELGLPNAMSDAINEKR